MDCGMTDNAPRNERQKKLRNERQRGGLNVRQHVSTAVAVDGEGSAARDCVSLPGGFSAAVWQARAGPVEPLRPGGVAEPVEYGAERDHRQRQLGDGWGDRGVLAAGDQLGADASAVQVAQGERRAGGDQDGVHSSWSGRWGGAK